MSKPRPDKKFERVRDAEQRVADWQNLSPTEQLEQLDARGVVAAKQRARIQTQLEEVEKPTKVARRRKKASE